MPGNSFSHDRSTYGWSPAVSQTSPALYSFGVTTDASISASRGSFAPPPPDMQPDRRAEEAEGVADLVDQEPLVREVKGRRDVGEEHKRRRRHRGLGCVEHPHVMAARACGRMRLGHPLDERVELPGPDALVPR